MPSAEQAAPKKKSLLASLTTPRGKAVRGVCVGVDVGPHSLRFVKTNRADGQEKVTGLWRVPFGAKDAPGTPGFPEFLRQKLTQFCEGERNPAIWGLVSSAGAELWHIRVPKVPASKLSETVYWTVQKEKPFDEKEFVFDFELQGEVMDKGVPKHQAMVFLVPRADVDKAEELFRVAGFKLEGLTISSIALQALFRKGHIHQGDSACANIFVGRNWSRIDVFSQGNLVLSRGVNTGLSSMVDALVEGYNTSEPLESDVPPAVSDPVEFVPGVVDAPSPTQHTGEIEFQLEIDSDPAPVTIESADDSALPEIELSLDDDTLSLEVEVPEPVVSMPAPMAVRETMTSEHARDIVRARLFGNELEEQIPGAELSDDEVFEFVLPALNRLARQLERTFEFFRNTHGGANVASILGSGDICSNQRVLSYLSSELGTTGALLDPLSSVPISPGVDVPQVQAERLTLDLVTGLALCNLDDTPNLLRTYKAKDNERRYHRYGNTVYGIFLFLAAVLTGVYIWQLGVVSDKTAQLGALSNRIATFAPVVDDTLLFETAAQYVTYQKRLKKLSGHYTGLALVNEVADRTPETIKIRSLNVEVPALQGQEQDKAKKTKVSLEEKPVGVLVLDGLVLGDPEQFDAELAGYLVRLSQSVLLDMPVIHTRKVESLADGQALRFIVHVKLGETS